jgi:hypothetical protein
VAAPGRKRSARDYEQALRRQELAAGRALVQAVGPEGSPGARELAAARRVLTQALFDLRRLARDLDQEIEGLRSRKPPAGSARSGAARPAQRPGPGELDQLEALREAVEEVAKRWEGRRDQLSAELDRRQPRQRQRGARERQAQGRRAGSSQPQSRGQGRGAAGNRGEVSGRRGGAPARPERPRSHRSRRSPG